MARSVLAEVDVLAEQRLGEAVDRRERRAQLVRDGGDEVRLHLLDAPLGGDVAESVDPARDGTGRIGHHGLAEREPHLLAAAPDRHEPAAAGNALRGLEWPPERLRRRPPECVALLNPGHPLGGRVPEDDLALAIDGDDAVGDVRQDRLAPLLLLADALIELGVHPRAGRCCRKRQQDLFLLRPPDSRPHRVDGEDALHRSVRTDHRDAEVRGVAGREHRVCVADPSVVPDVGDRPRGARLHDVADEPGRRGRARTDRLELALTRGRAPDHLVALEQPNRGASGLEQLDGGAYGDVEQVVRVELAGELHAGAREPLRKRAGTSLALVQLASLERAAGCTCDMARELELLVSEHRLAPEEDDHQREPGTGRLDERNREQ